MPYENLTTSSASRSRTSRAGPRRGTSPAPCRASGSSTTPRTASHAARELRRPPGIEATDAIVIGYWQGDDSQGSSQEVVEALVTYAERVPQPARALPRRHRLGGERDFLDQPERPVGALARLPEPGAPAGARRHRPGPRPVRGAASDALILESGGLPRRAVRDALAAGAPELRHLELWLGTEEYGGDNHAGRLRRSLRRPAVPEARDPGVTRLRLCRRPRRRARQGAFAGADHHPRSVARQPHRPGRRGAAGLARGSRACPGSTCTTTSSPTPRQAARDARAGGRSLRPAGGGGIRRHDLPQHRPSRNDGSRRLPARALRHPREGDGERAEGFNAALVRAGLPPAHVLDYARFAEAPDRLAGFFRRDAVSCASTSRREPAASAGRSCARRRRGRNGAMRARGCVPTMPCRAGCRRRFASPGGSCRPGSP